MAATVLEEKKRVRNADCSTTKLIIIGSIRILVANSESEKELKGSGVFTRSPFKKETYRDTEGRLTRFKTGRRFVCIDIPTEPLPKSK